MTLRLASLALLLALASGAAHAQTEQILRPTGTLAYDRVGTSVAVDGDRMLVGAPGDDQGGSNAGAAVLYEYANGSWTETATLVPPYAGDPQGAGYSVALDGDRAVLGAPYPAGYTGLAYVFDRINGSWVFTHTLTATPQTPGIGVGWSVALDGDRIVTGTPGDDTGATDAGAVLVFDFVSNAWTQTAVLRAASPAAYSYLGYSVDVSGDRVIAGAPVGGTTSGIDAAHIFEKTTSGWTEYVLTDPNGASGDRFGQAVAIDGPLAVVGAYRKTVASTHDGAAFVYEQVGNPWVQQARLDGTASHTSRGLGYSVGIDGARIVAGAISSPVQAETGAAFVYDGGASPTLTTRLEASDGAQGDLFGSAVAASGPHVAVGANSEDTAGAYAGAAYVYTDGPPVPFLLAQDAITVGKSDLIAGDLHSNGPVTLNRQSQGYSGSYDGSVTASGAISIDRRNIITGDVAAGGALTVHPSASIGGTASGNASVTPIALPGVASVTPGTQNVTVTSSQTLAPGAYRRVRAESNTGLTLTAGAYDLDRLQLRPFSTLTLDVSGGPITIQTATQLAIARDVILKVTGASGPDNGLSHLVTMRTAQATDVVIGNRSFVVGTLEAPLALVRLRADASYIGRLAAREIRVDNRTALWRHGAAPSLTAPAPPVASLGISESPEAAALTVAPNPLRDAAEVTFTLQEAASVRLTVYDALGREVAVLAEGPLAAGAHRATFDASALPAGVYVLRLATPTGSQTARVTRVR